MSTIKEMFVKYYAANAKVAQAKVEAEELVRKAIQERTDIVDAIVAEHGNSFELEDGKIVTAVTRKNKNKKKVVDDDDIDDAEAGADAGAGEEVEPEVIGHTSFFKTPSTGRKSKKEPKPKPEKPKPVKVG